MECYSFFPWKPFVWSLSATDKKKEAGTVCCYGNQIIGHLNTRADMPPPPPAVAPPLGVSNKEPCASRCSTLLLWASV